MNRINKAAYNPKFAEYYDLMTKHKDYLKECDFIEAVLSKFLKNHPNKILDVGCGTGSHALELAKRGYNIFAFDVAKPMIDIAIKKDTKNEVQFSHGDITHYRGKNFDAVICMFNTVNYLHSFLDFGIFLKNVCSAMSNRGIFIFDSWNGLAVMKIRPSNKLQVFDTERGKIYRYVEPEFNIIEQETILKYHCLVVKEKHVVDEFNSLHNIKFYTPDQIKNALDSSGFKILKSCALINLEKEISEKDWIVTYVVTPSC
jgi:SAM-dependent methyltransferase